MVNVCSWRTNDNDEECASGEIDRLITKKKKKKPCARWIDFDTLFIMCTYILALLDTLEISLSG